MDTNEFKARQLIFGPEGAIAHFYTQISILKNPSVSNVSVTYNNRRIKISKKELARWIRNNVPDYKFVKSDNALLDQVYKERTSNPDLVRLATSADTQLSHEFVKTILGMADKGDEDHEKILEEHNDKEEGLITPIDEADSKGDGAYEETDEQKPWTASQPPQYNQHQSSSHPSGGSRPDQKPWDEEKSAPKFTSQTTSQPTPDEGQFSRGAPKFKSTPVPTHTPRTPLPSSSDFKSSLGQKAQIGLHKFNTYGLRKTGKDLMSSASIKIKSFVSKHGIQIAGMTAGATGGYFLGAAGGPVGSLIGAGMGGLGGAMTGNYLANGAPPSMPSPKLVPAGATNLGSTNMGNFGRNSSFRGPWQTSLRGRGAGFGRFINSRSGIGRGNIPGGGSAGAQTWAFSTKKLALVAMGSLLFLLIGAGMLAMFFPGNNNTSTTGVPGSQNSVTIEKSGDPSVAKGGVITYRIAVTYKGAGKADITVIDPIPSTIKYLSSDEGGNFQTSPERTVDEGGGVVTWELKQLVAGTPKILTLNTQALPSADDSYVINQTQAKIIQVTGTPGQSKIITSNSRDLNEIFTNAANNAGVPIAFLKAIAMVETPGVFSYNDDEVRYFSTPGWWQSLSSGDPLLRRGYAYNTCAGNPACPSNDVMGPMQFELATWNGVKDRLVFADGHAPDRRNLVDAIYGSALFNKDNAVKYAKNTTISNWDEATVRKVARIYCGGPGELVTAACIAGDKTHDDLTWQYYQVFLNQP